MTNKPFDNGLSLAHHERLAVLAEEAAEIIQAVNKILRHGYYSKHPVTTELNSSALAREIGDFLGVLDLMIVAGDLSHLSIRDARAKRLESMRPYLHYQEELIVALGGKRNEIV